MKKIIFFFIAFFVYLSAPLASFASFHYNWSGTTLNVSFDDVSDFSGIDCEPSGQDPNYWTINTYSATGIANKLLEINDTPTSTQSLSLSNARNVGEIVVNVEVFFNTTPDVSDNPQGVCTLFSGFFTVTGTGFEGDPAVLAGSDALVQGVANSALTEFVLVILVGGALLVTIISVYFLIRKLRRFIR
jgi:hypothetical protein